MHLDSLGHVSDVQAFLNTTAPVAFTYVGYDPINHVDPSGKSSCPVTKAVIEDKKDASGYSNAQASGTATCKHFPFGSDVVINVQGHVTITSCIEYKYKRKKYSYCADGKDTDVGLGAGKTADATALLSCVPYSGWKFRAKISTDTELKWQQPSFGPDGAGWADMVPEPEHAKKNSGWKNVCG